MLDLVLIRGLPGSGKTTLAHKLMRMSPVNTYLAEADSFFTYVNYGKSDRIEYNFDRRLLGAAHDWCYGHAMRALMQDTPVIVSNTFSTVRELERYIEGVRRSGKRVRITVIKCDGEFESVHNVPQRAIERMKDRWEDFPGEVQHSV